VSDKGLNYYIQHANEDIPAGLVVFLVALPLCLGIALAAGAPPFAGVISGIVGGLVVAFISGSQLVVSGPSPGSIVIVAVAVEKFGFDGLLYATMISGLIQLGMGCLRAGVIGAYFPAAVIKGMLAAIGIILIMKQVPHALGFDADADSDLSFLENDSHTTLSLLFSSFDSLSLGATIVAVCSILIMLLWETSWVKKNRFLSLLPGALVAVLFGITYSFLTQFYYPDFGIAQQHLVSLPKLSGPLDFVRQVHFPDFSQIFEPHIYVTAATLALVGSLEALLTLEAVNKLDPMKRLAPTNQELFAQGFGNFVSGLIGGLPLTAVIIRSSANIDAGARTKLSAIMHGVFLMISVMFLSTLMNKIPLSCLAAVLLITGYKLARPSIFIEQYARGFNQFTPFAVTVAAILLTDLLKGMAIGMAVGLFFVLRANYHSAFTLTHDGSNILLRLQKDVSFLNKAPLRDCLEKIKDGTFLLIDGTRATFIDHDILETLADFIKAADERNITVELKNIRGIENVNYSAQKAS
jgi:MFS superfamily sulfate permease-like transporter